MSVQLISSFHELSYALSRHYIPSFHQEWLSILSVIGPFPILELPVEIAAEILRLATFQSGATYAALQRTSLRVAELARAYSAPTVVILSFPWEAISFHASILAHPEIGLAVRELWFLPALPSKRYTSIGPDIIYACFNLRRLTCVPATLLSICSSRDFLHKSLVDLTITEPIMPWIRLLATSHGARLFSQLEKLRLVGGTSPLPPPASMFFPNLTDLSLPANNTSRAVTYLADTTHFPRLQRVVATIPYPYWRDEGLGFLMSDAALGDARLAVLHCPKRWKEIDVWPKGAAGIWNAAVDEWNAAFPEKVGKKCVPVE